jgi:integrase/recombinase XerD
MKRPSVSLLFDKRRMKEGFASVKLSIYYNAQQKQYATGIILDEKQLDFLAKNKAGLTGKVRDENLRNLWNRIYGREYIDDATEGKKETWLLKAQKVISKIEHRFSFEEFQVLLFSEQQTEVGFTNDLIVALRSEFTKLVSEDNFTKASIYRSAANSVERFVTETGITNKTLPKVPFGLITRAFLKKYEKFLVTNGGINAKSKARRPVGPTTVAFYMNAIKKMVNEAIKAKVINRDDYPFGSDGYRPPRGNNTKKALPTEILAALMAYSGKFPRRNYALDIWKFSYFCGGMNMTDVARLRWRNVDLTQREISFVRRKTRTSKANAGAGITLSLLPEAVEIINKWAQASNDQNDFVFPEVNQQMSEKEIHSTIFNLTQRVNRMLVLILKELGIQAKVRTYEARHSYATTLARAHVPLAFISQGLGHSSLKTTEQYLGSFEYDQTQKFLSALIPKKQESQDS